MFDVDIHIPRYKISYKRTSSMDVVEHRLQILTNSKFPELINTTSLKALTGRLLKFRRETY